MDQTSGSRKRWRTPNFHNHQCEHINTRRDGLPAEVWAHVVEFLPFKDVLHCSQVSRPFLHNVMPLVRVLSIGHPWEMHSAPLRRFPNVEALKVLCLISPKQIVGMSLCEDTCDRVVHFLSLFERLREAFLGGSKKFQRRFVYQQNYCVSPPGHETIMYALVRSVCGGYRTGALRKELKLDGIYGGEGSDKFVCCLNGADPSLRNGLQCEMCRRICTSIPMCQALTLSSRSSSDDDVVGGGEMNWSPFLCLSQKEHLSAIASRHGGHDFLRLPRNILNVLATNPNYGTEEFQCDRDGMPSHAGKYYARALFFRPNLLDFLELLVTRYRCDPTPLESESVWNIIFPIANYEEAISHDKCTLFMFKGTVDHFAAMGIPLHYGGTRVIDEEFLLHDQENNWRTKRYYNENWTL